MDNFHRSRDSRLETSLHCRMASKGRAMLKSRIRRETDLEGIDMTYWPKPYASRQEDRVLRAEEIARNLGGSSVVRTYSSATTVRVSSTMYIARGMLKVPRCSTVLRHGAESPGTNSCSMRNLPALVPA